MDTFSRFDSTIPISPETGRVWKTHKRSRTGDNKERDGGRQKKSKQENKDIEMAAKNLEKTDNDVPNPQNPQEEEQAVYGTDGYRKNISRKIDVII